MNERLFSFRMSDGSIEFLSIEDAIKKKDPSILKRVEEIILNLKNKRTVKDGFQSGWQENIQMYVGGRREYDKILKEKGLVEVGYDYTPTDSSSAPTGLSGINLAEDAKELGLDLNEQEIDAIKDGSYFESIE